jgi:hypothetical protein
MMPRQSQSLFQVTNPSAVASHTRVQPAVIEKLRTKRITCITCDNKVCVGRCRFRKSH